MRQTRKPVLITKQGRPVDKLVPAEDSPPPLFGGMAGTIEIPGEIWDAEK